MDITIFLAQVSGLYLVILGLTMLLHQENFISIVTGIFHNAAIQYILGLNLLLIGLLMVDSHNIWESSWIVVVTILSWLILLKGLFYVVFPKQMTVLAHHFIRRKQWVYASAIINLFLGLYLCYMGFYIN
jgi:hypothetical protein